jgi:hypothetical protein
LSPKQLASIVSTALARIEASPSIQVIMDANAVFTPTGKQIRDLSIIIEKLL